jgi:probable rRNA maturation factor
MTPSIDVLDSARAGPRVIAAIRRALAEAMRVERRPMRLSVALVSDRPMRRLERAFHGGDRTTDVLAFPLGGGVGPAEEAVDGEIIVCAAVARREARARRVPLTWEASLYAIHGYLHLRGYDDHAEPGARAMALRTARILRGLGYDVDRLEVVPRGSAARRRAATVASPAASRSSR